MNLKNLVFVTWAMAIYCYALDSVLLPANDIHGLFAVSGSVQIWIFIE